MVRERDRKMLINIGRESNRQAETNRQGEREIEMEREIKRDGQVLGVEESQLQLCICMNICMHACIYPPLCQNI